MINKYNKQKILNLKLYYNIMNLRKRNKTVNKSRAGKNKKTIEQVRQEKVI